MPPVHCRHVLLSIYLSSRGEPVNTCPFVRVPSGIMPPGPSVVAGLPEIDDTKRLHPILRWLASTLQQRPSLVCLVSGDVLARPAYSVLFSPCATGPAIWTKRPPDVCVGIPAARGIRVRPRGQPGHGTRGRRGGGGRRWSGGRVGVHVPLGGALRCCVPADGHGLGTWGPARRGARGGALAPRCLASRSSSSSVLGLSSRN